MHENILTFKDFSFDVDQTKFSVHHKPVEEVRLVIIDKKAGTIEHDMFLNLHEYLRDNDEIVMNDVGISRSRLQSTTAGVPIDVCFLLEDLENPQIWEAIILGEELPPESGNFHTLYGIINGKLLGKVSDFDGSYWIEKDRYCGYRGRVEIDVSPDMLREILNEHGQLMHPWYTDVNELPPEILNPSVAIKAGGALLSEPSRRMNNDILNRCTGNGARLTHVSINLAFAWRPAEAEDVVDGFSMNNEQINISPIAAGRINKAVYDGRRIVAVGTGPARALESMEIPAREFFGQTNLFISPGFKFKYCQSLITNLHVPMSTHVVMACAFGGLELVLDAYNESVQRGYSFGIHGDSMLIHGDHEPNATKTNCVKMGSITAC